MLSRFGHRFIFIILGIIIACSNMGLTWSVAFVGLAVGYLLGDFSYWLQDLVEVLCS